MNWDTIESWTGIASAPDAGEVPGSYNIKPTNRVPILCRRPDTGARAGVLARWGLIPHWHKSTARDWKASTFNARADRLGEGLWRGVQKNRCVFPVAGYYEWKTEGKSKTPFYIHPAGNAPGLLFAGLWSRVELPDLSGLTCTIITEPSSGAMTDLHDRIPVVIGVEAAEDWLGGAEIGDLKRLPVDALAWHEVGKSIGRREAEGPQLTEPL